MVQASRAVLIVSLCCMLNVCKCLILITATYSLMIRNSLDEGTQLPYIRKALGLGYGVVVLNTNDNKPVEVGD